MHIYYIVCIVCSTAAEERWPQHKTGCYNISSVSNRSWKLWVSWRRIKTDLISADRIWYGVYAVTTKQDGSSSIRKVSSSRSRIPNGITWNPLVKFLWAKRLKKYASQRSSKGRKQWNAQSKAAKPGFRRGRRARPTGLLLCPMQIHVKLLEKRSKLSGYFRSLKSNGWVSGHPVWDSGPTPRDLLNETTPVLFGGDCIDPICYRFNENISITVG
jgi:hypothetical protein